MRIKILTTIIIVTFLCLSSGCLKSEENNVNTTIPANNLTINIVGDVTDYSFSPTSPVVEKTEIVKNNKTTITGFVTKVVYRNNRTDIIVIEDKDSITIIGAWCFEYATGDIEVQKMQKIVLCPCPKGHNHWHFERVDSESYI